MFICKLVTFFCFHGIGLALHCDDASRNRAVEVAKLLAQFRERGLNPINHDEIIKAARREGLSPQEFVAKYSNSVGDGTSKTPSDVGPKNDALDILTDVDNRIDRMASKIFQRHEVEKN